MKRDSFGYRHNQQIVGLCHVHLVWIPKRRKKVLVGDVRQRLYEILEEVAKDNGWVIKAKEIEPDHVHLLVEYDEETAINELVRAFKGKSASLLRKEFPALTKIPSLWTRSYFYDTASQVTAERIVSYINDPHHDKH